MRLKGAEIMADAVYRRLRQKCFLPRRLQYPDKGASGYDKVSAVCPENNEKTRCPRAATYSKQLSRTSYAINSAVARGSCKRARSVCGCFARRPRL